MHLDAEGDDEHVLYLVDQVAEPEGEDDNLEAGQENLAEIGLLLDVGHHQPEQIDSGVEGEEENLVENSLWDAREPLGLFRGILVISRPETGLAYHAPAELGCPLEVASYSVRGVGI